jgi:hypothetical protein
VVVHDVSERLGIDSDFASEKGDLRSSGSTRRIRQQTGVWLIGSKGRLETTSLERHLVYLLPRIADVGAKLRFDFYGPFTNDEASSFSARGMGSDPDTRV